jgi:hypothetical protein
MEKAFHFLPCQSSQKKLHFSYNKMTSFLNNTYQNQVILYGGIAFVGAQYFDTTDQPNAGSTGNTFTFNTIDFQSGISLVSNSKITVAENGFYSLSFSVQFINTSSQEQYVDIWFLKNCSVIPNSNSEFGVVRRQSGIDGKVIASSTFFFPLMANDELELLWNSSSVDVDVEYLSPKPFVPATPSVIVNIQRISS